MLRAFSGQPTHAASALEKNNYPPSKQKMVRKDKLYSFTAISVDEDTDAYKTLARMYRRDSCKELRVAMDALQLSKLKQSEKELSETTNLDSAYSVILTRKDLLSLVDEYTNAAEDTELTFSYDFDPEISFFNAAWGGSSGNDQILIVCICYDDGEHIDDMESDDDC